MFVLSAMPKWGLSTYVSFSNVKKCWLRGFHFGRPQANPTSFLRKAGTTCQLYIMRFPHGCTLNHCTCQYLVLCHLAYLDLTTLTSEHFPDSHRMRAMELAMCACASLLSTLLAMPVDHTILYTTPMRALLSLRIQDHSTSRRHGDPP
jgi:hypothetical protein